MRERRSIRRDRRGTTGGGSKAASTLAPLLAPPAPLFPSTVREAMTAPVVQLAPRDTLAVALSRLRNANVSGGPVVSREGRVLGVLSERDIAQSVGARWLSSRPMEVLDLVLPGSAWSRPDALRNLREGLQNLRVEDAMTTPPEVVEAKAPLGEAIRRMKVRHVNRLPVVEGGRLVGIITRRDLISCWPVEGTSRT